MGQKLRDCRTEDHRLAFNTLINMSVAVVVVANTDVD